MIAGFTLFKMLTWFRGSLIGQIAIGAVALMGIWKINNVVVARKTIAKVEQAAIEDGKTRNAKTAKIRRSIEPGSAMRRLRREYAGSR